MLKEEYVVRQHKLFRSKEFCTTRANAAACSP